MKVAGIKGIRVIMGAAKDERGSVFCNTKFFKSALASNCRKQTSAGPWLEGAQKPRIHCLLHCSCDAFTVVLAESKEASEIQFLRALRSSVIWFCPKSLRNFPSSAQGNKDWWSSLECEEGVKYRLRSECVKRALHFRGPASTGSVGLAVAELSCFSRLWCGSELPSAHLDTCALQEWATPQSCNFHAAESRLPLFSVPWWECCLSFCIVNRWQMLLVGSVALNCAPPNMLDVWPDLQAKGVRWIKPVNFFLKQMFLIPF